jgi:hypothetical protein
MTEDLRAEMKARLEAAFLNHPDRPRLNMEPALWAEAVQRTLIEITADVLAEVKARSGALFTPQSGWGWVPTHYHPKTNALYRVIGYGRHTEIGEELVFYESAGSDTLWARPRKMFEEPGRFLPIGKAPLRAPVQEFGVKRDDWKV